MTEKIESSLFDYLRSARDQSEVSTRARAVRYVTGELEVLPSEVVVVITRLVQAGTLIEKLDGQLVEKR